MNIPKSSDATFVSGGWSVF